MSLSSRVVAASQGRDRVVDAAKALALLLVVVGHALAWTVLPDGSVTNTLEAAPQAFPLTWVLQILPVFFFLAGAGMGRYAGHPTSAGLLRRVDRLVSPTVPLFLVTVATAVALAATVGGPVAAAAGVLPVQLTWFIGVYLIVLSLSPLLARLRRPVSLAALLGAIAAVDAVRATAVPAVGWANMVLVWSLFAAVGMGLPRWRRTRVRTLGCAGAVFAAAAAVAVWVGPYSPALVTTPALPGLSNLAPPTLVLALAGLAQICALLACWGALARMLQSDRVWVPVALFSARAMGVYLWHMLVLSLLVGAVLASGLRPPALSAPWWALHAAVLAVLCAGVWALAPAALAAGDALARTTARLVPGAVALRAAAVPAWACALACCALGLGYLLASESGVSDPLSWRPVLGLPYLPAGMVAVLAVFSAVARRATSAPASTRAPAPPGEPPRQEPG